MTTSNDFLRIATIAPELRVADITFNHRELAKQIGLIAERGAQLALFPELSLTGYTCGDLFAQSLLQQNCVTALLSLAETTAQHSVHVVIGLPLVIKDRLFNCAALIGRGVVLGIIPKQHLPSTGEYYEERWFTSGSKLGESEITLSGNVTVPIGIDLLFEDSLRAVTLGIEVCEDLWAVQPPSGDLCVAGANVILNPSASNELLGKAKYRRELVSQQSARCLAAYAYASAGPDESSSDLVFSGHSIIAENGVILSESDRFQFESKITLADIDIQRLRHERICNSSFSAIASANTYRQIKIDLGPKTRGVTPGTLRPNPARPFVPSNEAKRSETCREIFAIQATGLAKRLRHTGAQNVVLGISGGLDSTLALLVTIQAFDLLGLDRHGILAPTMPGFGTTQRTRGNAENLVESLGATLRVIPIHEAVKQHFKDIGHPEDRYDVTYENSQARERTQILMDLANKTDGFVVGTGDLSESALGWCTFNGDHMSMYHVNAGVPKTLVSYLIQWCADSKFEGDISRILHDIIDTPISPELLPVNHEGAQEQQTEDVVGPYELHDFFLYHVIRHGSCPSKVLYLAEMAFAERFNRQTILKWLEVFIRRFFSQQFKRNAMPDGPKVGSVALSPRGDWRMPSDASASDWLSEIQALRSS